MTRAMLPVGAALVMLAACVSTEPRPIALNEDSCTYCRMTISDSRFGGEVVTKTGRVLTFDSIECLAGWYRTADTATVAGVYTIDLQHPGTFVDARKGGFLRGAVLKSPMGESIVGFVSAEVAEQQRTMLGGVVMTWEQLLAGSGAAEAVKH